VTNSPTISDIDDYVISQEPRSPSHRYGKRPLLSAFVVSVIFHGLIVWGWSAITSTQPQEQDLPAVLHAQLAKTVQQEQVKQQTGVLDSSPGEVIQQATSASRATPQQEQKEAPKKPEQEQTSVDTLTANKAKQKTYKTDKLVNSPSEQQVQETPKEIQLEAKDNSTEQEAITRQAQTEAIQESRSPTYNNYHKQLTNYLTQYLAAPKGYEGTLRLKIQLAYGGVPIGVYIIESSGNREIDEWAKRQAIAAGPYPAIPKELGSTFEFAPTLVFGSEIIAE